MFIYIVACTLSLVETTTEDQNKSNQAHNVRNQGIEVLALKNRNYALVESVKFEQYIKIESNGNPPIVKPKANTKQKIQIEEIPGNNKPIKRSYVIQGKSMRYDSNEIPEGVIATLREKDYKYYSVSDETIWIKKPSAQPDNKIEMDPRNVGCISNIVSIDDVVTTWTPVVSDELRATNKKQNSFSLIEMTFANPTDGRLFKILVDKNMGSMPIKTQLIKNKRVYVEKTINYIKLVNGAYFPEREIILSRSPKGKNQEWVSKIEITYENFRDINVPIDETYFDISQKPSKRTISEFNSGQIQKKPFFSKIVLLVLINVGIIAGLIAFLIVRKKRTEESSGNNERKAHT